MLADRSAAVAGQSGEDSWLSTEHGCSACHRTRSLPRGNRLRDRRGLLLLAVGLPVVGALLLVLFGPPGSAALAPHVTATAPFGTFHDLRWLFVYSPSWVAFGFELVLLIGFRIAVTVGLVRGAWPEEVERPSVATTGGYAAAFTAVSVVVLSPFAALLVGMSAVSVSWPFFVAVPAVATIALFAHHGPVRGPWWRTAPASRTVAWVGLSFVVLTVTGMFVSLAPSMLVVAVVAAGGLFNAWAWYGIVRALTRVRRPVRRFLPVVPAGIASLMATIIVGASIGFAVTEKLAVAAEPVPWTPSEHRPVLVVSGFGSSYDSG